jgi:hypothetical protein
VTCKGLRSMCSAVRRSQCPTHKVNEPCEGVNGTSTSQTPKHIFRKVTAVLGPAVLCTEQNLHVFTCSYYFICAHQSVNRQRRCDCVVCIQLITKKYVSHPTVTNDNGAWFYPRHDYLKLSRGGTDGDRHRKVLRDSCSTQPNT